MESKTASAATSETARGNESESRRESGVRAHVELQGEAEAKVKTTVKVEKTHE